MKSIVDDIDGKIWAQQGAEATVDALGVIHDLRRVVAFGVGALRHDKDLLGAELDTEAAALATILNNADNSAGNLDAFAI
jgi:hypothetical protein